MRGAISQSRCNGSRERATRAWADDDDDSNTGGAGGSGATSGSGGFTPPADPGPGGFWVTVSGEDLAILGYDFVAGSSLADGDPPAFVDGWAVKFDHVNADTVAVAVLI